MLMPHPRAKGCVLGVVADGMGGRSGGRKASDQVLMTARQLFDRYMPYEDDAEQILRQISLESHTVIKLTAISTEQEPHSTIAAFLVNPRGDAHAITSGDSRVYIFRGDELLYRSRDHSHVRNLVDRGEITEKEADNHPLSNILTSCLGIEQEPQLAYHALPAMQLGDIIMACSDGLWHYFSTSELGMVLSSLSPRHAAELLVKKARERALGAGDNLSLALVKVEAAQLEV